MTRREAPGPARRPSTDELLALRSGPHAFLLQVARTYGGIARYPVGPFPFYVVTDPELVWTVLVERHDVYTKDTFQYRLLAHVTGAGLLTMDGPDWLVRRRMEQPAFHRASITRFGSLMAAAAERMADRWDAAATRGEPVDAAAAMMHVALQVVAQALFSVEVGDEADELAQATLTVLDRVMFRARTLGSIPRWLPTPGNRRFRRALGVLDTAISRTIRERRADPAAGDDFLSRLMQAGAQPGGVALTDRQLRDEMVTMLVAGHETVASALAWTWWLLAQHPEADARLADEARQVTRTRPVTAEDAAGLTWTTQVFQETMRLYPPAWMISRRAMRADELGGYDVPRKANVVLSPYATHRLAHHWPDPDRFDPARFDAAAAAGRHRGAYLPFGAGPHLCIGNHFALLEATIVLATLARRFRLEAVPGRDPVAEPGVTLHPKHGLWLRVVRR